MHYLMRRLLQTIPTLVGVVVVSFVLIQLIPGDPARTLAGEDADQVSLAKARAQYGLDQPVADQFLRYTGRLVQGDLGQSYSYGEPVTKVIRGALYPTLLLTGTALIISLVVGILLGVQAARRESGFIDHAIGVTTLTAFAVPGFWLAQLAILFLVLRWHIFPLQGMSTVSASSSTGLNHVADVAYHLMLPALVLAASEVGAVSRLVRSGLLTEMRRDYTRAAEAKGVSPERVVSHHVLRNALLPVITLVGSRVGFLFSGAVVIESLFVWPGLGSVLRSAATTNIDPPLILGIVIVSAATIVIANVITDLAYTWADPRVRLG
jgi:peptide/nickel transport system permease protein